jgi:hypothetical protein
MTQPLRVEVTRSGGLTGITRSWAVETAPEDAEAPATALRELVAAADLVGSSRGSGAGGADRYQYDVTILDGTDRRSYSLQETDLTEAQRRLVRWVMSAGSDNA